jgi:predicted phage terminase large subunit-like protein
LPVLEKEQTQQETIPNIAVDEYDLIASITRESFYEFVKEFWSDIIAEQFVNNWHIRYICGELQIAAERVFAGLPKLYDLLINVSPGTSKSTICSIMFPAWCWVRMSSCRIIGASYTYDIQMDLARRNKDLILSEKYQKAFPHIKLREDQSAKSYFMNTMRGSRYSVGIGGGLAGMHGHIAIIDDPINPKEALSEVALKTANTWMNESLPTRKVDKAVSLTILIMQRLHQNDPSANMIKNTPALKHICLPAILTNKVRPANLARYYKDSLFDVRRLPRTVLVEQKTLLGEYAYAGQFLQWPIPLGGGMFKADRIKIMPLPADIKWFKIVRSWDKAGTKDAGAYTAGVKIGKDSKGRFWLCNVTRGRWDTNEREDIIKRNAEMDTRAIEVVLEQEPGSGGKADMQATVRNLAGWRVFVSKPGGSDSSKVLRADPFSVQVNNGNVYMIPAPWNKDFLDEMSFFPYSTYKDQIDAASTGFNRLTGSVVVGGWF